VVAATFNPADGKGQSIAVTYGTMPTRYNHFGKKTIAMSMENTEFKWYQDVEFFFHYAGTGGRAGANPVPNWFFYWSQIKSATAAPGNGGFSFRHGAASEWIFDSNGTAAGTTSRIEILAPSSLSAFIGITAHEQKHEDDFWRVVWDGTGYKPAEDADFDGLRDAWETAQYGNLNKDLDNMLETTATTGYAWSDVRADIAAKDAVNAHLGIDALDWSDQKVSSGIESGTKIIWQDDDPPDDTHRQECSPTTSGNHKNF
jgi:hypothetical protein